MKNTLKEYRILDVFVRELCCWWQKCFLFCLHEATREIMTNPPRRLIAMTSQEKRLLWSRFLQMYTTLLIGNSGWFFLSEDERFSAVSKQWKHKTHQHHDKFLSEEEITKKTLDRISELVVIISKEQEKPDFFSDTAFCQTLVKYN